MAKLLEVFNTIWQEYLLKGVVLKPPDWIDALDEAAPPMAGQRFLKLAVIQEPFQRSLLGKG